MGRCRSQVGRNSEQYFAGRLPTQVWYLRYKILFGRRSNFVSYLGRFSTIVTTTTWFRETTPMLSPTLEKTKAHFSPFPYAFAILYAQFHITVLKSELKD